jgi:hypothetical protein
MNFESPTSYSTYFYLFFTDNLKFDTDVSFVSSYPNIGLSFERFNGRRYISNAKMTLFPEDEGFALSLVG